MGPEALHCPWSAFAPGSPGFCERRLCEWIVEPSNTWSNLPYLFVGLYILWAERGKPRSSLYAIAVTSILVGIGSFAFHATATFIGQVLDVSAMYLISGMFIVFALRRYYQWSDFKLIVIFLVVTIPAIALLIWEKETGIPMFAAQVTVAGLYEIRMYRKRRGNTDYWPMVKLIAWFVAAFTIWALDITGILCDPDNHIFTGHAFWHIACSLSMVYFYKFQRQFRVTPGMPSAHGVP